MDVMVVESNTKDSDYHDAFARYSLESSLYLHDWSNLLQILKDFKSNEKLKNFTKVTSELVGYPKLKNITQKCL